MCNVAFINVISMVIRSYVIRIECEGIVIISKAIISNVKISKVL